MFWPVVSIAACAASRPLSAVCSPMKLGIVIPFSTSRSRTRWPVRRRPWSGQPVAAGVVALVAGEADELEEMIEERQLLAHQRAVDVVLALDLLEQPAQFGAAGVRGVRRIGVHQRLEQRDRDPTPGFDAQPRAGALEQQRCARSRARRRYSSAWSTPVSAQRRSDVAVADRGALLEHDSEQPPSGDELGISRWAITWLVRTASAGSRITAVP